MLGCHQLHKALTAICAILCLQEQGWAGLEQACVAGRFQAIPKADTLKLLGDQDHLALVLDGAPTESSAAMLERTLKMVFPSQPLTLIIAMTSDKHSYKFCTRLLPDLYSSLFRGLNPKPKFCTQLLPDLYSSLKSL